MRIIIYTVAAAVVVGFALVGWSVAGSLMTKGGDMGVLKGVLILAGIVGLAGAAAGGAARKIAAHFDGLPEDKKGCCK